MSRRRNNRGARLVASFAVLGIVLALAAGLRAASAATNGFDIQAKGNNSKAAKQAAKAAQDAVKHASQGPGNADFIDINKVRANVKQTRNGRNASTGTFETQCGTNADGHNNPNNYIVSPGVQDGAQHQHDYVGNTTTDANSNNKNLAQGDTTCQNQADKSAYFWPVLRDTRGKDNDAKQKGGGLDGNVGKILQPTSAKIQFLGNPSSRVIPMKNNLRIVTGDAKAITNGPKNARAQWTCTGFEDRTTTKYPLCPNGSQVESILDFPGCWDGQNTDSADHRSHTAFASNNGKCPKGFKAIPQLRYTLTWDVPAGKNFAIDAFPTETHQAITEHGDFQAVMSNSLLRGIANCINSGQNCVNQPNGAANGNNANNGNNQNCDNNNAGNNQNNQNGNNQNAGSNNGGNQNQNNNNQNQNNNNNQNSTNNQNQNNNNNQNGDNNGQNANCDNNGGDQNAGNNNNAGNNDNNQNGSNQNGSGNNAGDNGGNNQNGGNNSGSNSGSSYRNR